MKIRITKQLPVDEHARPEVGQVYEVTRRQLAFMTSRGFWCPEMYFIKVDLADVGVRPDECEIVEAES